MQTHKQMHLESLNFALDSQPSKGDEWEGVCSAQDDVKMIKKPRMFAKSRPPTIYKRPQIIESLGSSLCAKPTDGCHMSLFESNVYNLNGHEDSQRVINAVTGRADAKHLTMLNVASGHFQRGFTAPKF
jgi:hypothetical protein